MKREPQRALYHRQTIRHVANMDSERLRQRALQLRELAARINDERAGEAALGLANQCEHEAAEIERGETGQSDNDNS